MCKKVLGLIISLAVCAGLHAQILAPLAAGVPEPAGGGPMTLTTIGVTNGGVNIACPASNTTTGDALIVFGFANTSPGTVSASDTAGDTFTAGTVASLSGTTFNYLVAQNITAHAGNVITVAVPAAGDTHAYCFEVHNAVTSGPIIDVAINGDSGYCGLCTTASFTPAHTNEAVLVFYYSNSGPEGNFTAGSGYTLAVQDNTGGPGLSYSAVEYLISPTTTAQTATMNTPGNNGLYYVVSVIGL